MGRGARVERGWNRIIRNSGHDLKSTRRYRSLSIAPSPSSLEGSSTGNTATRPRFYGGDFGRPVDSHSWLIERFLTDVSSDKGENIGDVSPKLYIYTQVESNFPISREGIKIELEMRVYIMLPYNSNASEFTYLTIGDSQIFLSPDK